VNTISKITIAPAGVKGKERSGETRRKAKLLAKEFEEREDCSSFPAQMRKNRKKSPRERQESPRREK